MADTILITGGTGSFGSAFARFVLAETAAHVRLFSRDPHKQEALARELPSGERVTYVLGDLRNIDNLGMAADGCAAIVHAAAFKIVGSAEQSPGECESVNVTGTENVIAAALACRVGRSLFISSDKACSPLNAYGATKMLGERLWTQANRLGVTRGARFASVRGGNVWASNGSVALRWKAAADAGEPLVVNAPETTRFHLEMGAWVRFAWRALNQMHGGEVFVPHARAWRLGSLAMAFSAPGGVHETTARLGDKANETLYTADESARTIDAGWAYVVEPPGELCAVWNYAPWDGQRVPPGAYTSDAAPRLSGAELAALVKELP